MMDKLKIFDNDGGDFKKKVEYCYQLCSNTWEEIKGITSEHYFRSDEAEIEFYKVLKPKFTAEIEYYRLVYHSILFKPEDDMTQKLFWIREQRRFEYFIEEHKEFYNYYKNGSTDKDKEYFTRIDEDHIDFSQVRIFDIGSNTISPKGHLISIILSLEKYNSYVLKQREKMGYLDDQEQNNKDSHN